MGGFQSFVAQSDTTSATKAKRGPVTVIVWVWAVNNRVYP